MQNYQELSLLMERTIHKYIQWEKQPRCYGPGILLSQTEIHTIAAIGNHPGINVTELAKLRGITKGAASQMVYKLVGKGFVEKRVSPTSDTEVCLTLTEAGDVPYQNHMEFHRTSNMEFFQLLRGISEEVQEQFIHILEQFDQLMDARLQKK